MEGQVYSTCASPCTFTCDNVNELGCIALCTTGCDCPGGRVIDTEINKCVLIEECPNINNGKCSLHKCLNAMPQHVYLLAGTNAGSFVYNCTT